MTGKEKCNLLRRIRRDIAAANNIPYAERACTHTGECIGTCPYCEAELRRLERSLSERRSLGKRIAVVGLSMGLLSVNLTSCDNPFSRNNQLQGDMLPPDTTGSEQIEQTTHLPGELVESTTTTEPPVVEGLMPVEPLMGDPVLPGPEESTMGAPLPETDLPEPEDDSTVTTEPYVETTVLMGTMPVPETETVGELVGDDQLLPEPEEERDAVTIAPEIIPDSSAS